MARYVYRARGRAGILETGTLEAESERAAAIVLRGRGFMVTSLVRQEEAESATRQVSRFFRVNRTDLVLFTRQLATMISAGLPIVSALRVLEEQATNARLKEIIASVRVGIEQGGSLSGEIAKHPQAFFEFYVNTVRAGEVSGVLDTSLNYLADYLERELDLIQRVRTAATYPLVVLSFTMLVALGAVIFIIPSFSSIFASFKVGLPLITVVMLRVSQLVRQFWWVIVLGIGGLIVGMFVLRNSPRGQRLIDPLILRVPIMGPIVLKLAYARFGRSLAVVIRSGVPILEGLTAVAGALGNRVVGDSVERARARMREGQSMADALSASPLMPPMIVQMVRVGEETGAMEDILNKVAEFYEREVDNTVKRFASIIEPVLIIGVGAVVGLVALSVLLPIWSLVSNLPR
ncbi:MAG: type II secretion system F family protein [bacterium]